LEQSRNIECSNSYDLPLCIRNSSTEWPDLKFDIDGKNYFIPKDSYVECDDSYCYLYIMEDSSTEYDSDTTDTESTEDEIIYLNDGSDDIYEIEREMSCSEII
jgi:hypothetical protein